jgi:predicted ATP-grasp superfamily ATP-dependent carboligase
MSMPLQQPENLQCSMPRKNKTCLIIAQSGRALAQSARASGGPAHVLDRFADEDTASAALSCQVVSGDDGGFQIDDLMGKLAFFNRKPLQGIIYGSGLDGQYEVLDFLRKHWTLFGNEASVVKSCKEPALFFPMLVRCGIPHPPTSLTKPVGISRHQNWLIKKIGASGGGHIRAFAADAPAVPQCYFQKKLTGRSLSVVFLADTLHATIVGLNEIWTVDPGNDDFRYSGAATHPDVPEAVTRALEDMVCILVRGLGLQGLCGMDVILDENDQCHVLEINPRPPATFELHQKQQNLYEAHIQACQGKLTRYTTAPPLLRAHQVWYADRDFIVPDTSWPDWISDRPRSGRTLRTGAPICVVHAEAGCKNDLRMLLECRYAEIRAVLGLRQLAA